MQLQKDGLLNKTAPTAVSDGDVIQETARLHAVCAADL